MKHGGGFSCSILHIPVLSRSIVSTNVDFTASLSNILCSKSFRLSGIIFPNRVSSGMPSPKGSRADKGGEKIDVVADGFEGRRRGHQHEAKSNDSRRGHAGDTAQSACRRRPVASGRAERNVSRACGAVQSNACQSKPCAGGPPVPGAGRAGVTSPGAAFPAGAPERCRDATRAGCFELPA